LFDKDVEAHAAELANHFNQAKPVIGPEKLVHYSILAGEHALAAYGWEGAIAHYQTALEELEAGSRQQAEVMEMLALATSLGKDKGALDHWEKALAIYETLQDGPKTAAVHLRLGHRQGGIASGKDRYPHNMKAVGLLEQGIESTRLAQGYVQLGDNAIHGYGERSTGLPLMEKGMALAERLGDSAGPIEVVTWLGHALFYHTGDVSRCLALYAQGFEEAKKLGNLVVLGETAYVLSREYAYLPDSKNALHWAE